MSRTVSRWTFALFFTAVIALIAVQASEAAPLDQGIGVAEVVAPDYVKD